MKRDWTSRSTILIIGLILVVVNLISLNLFGRLDLTDDGVYSLSDASRELVETLDDPVTVTAWFTDNLPAPWSANRRFLKDKLDDYRAYGGSNFQYRFVDPGDDEDLRAEVNRMGIPPVQIQVIESDNVQLKNAYMGVVIEYGGERETLPVVQDLSTLEYDVTSAVRKLTREFAPTVGFLTGHGEPDPMSDLQSLNRELARNYTVSPVTVDGDQLSERPDALVIVAPSDTLDEGTLRAIDGYIQGGGRVAFLLNAVFADLQTGRAESMSVGIEPMLSVYGLGLESDLIMDQQSSAVTVQSQQGFFNVQRQIEYPFFPISTRFNPDNIMVSRLQQLMFYYVSSVDTSMAVPDGVTREVLVESTEKAGRQQGFFMVQPMMDGFPLEDGPFPLAAAYTGSFKSAYQEGQTSVPTRLVLVGDGDLLNEQIVGAIPGNVQFGLNLVDWLVQDDALLTIRSKSIEPRYLEPVSDGARPWIKYGTMLLPLLLVIGVGLVRWRSRRNRTVIIVR